jgi:tetratricopeptide (TPR) repeat protein
MLRRVQQLAFLVLLLLVWVPGLVLAGGLRARVVDQSKKALQKVDCRLVNLQTGEAISLPSDKKGEVRFESLSPGLYQLYGQLESYLPAKSEVLQVAGKDTEIRLVLPQEKALRKIESDGTVAFENQEYEKALGLYQEALALAPWESTLRSNVMLAMIRQKKGDKAREVAQQAAKYDPAAFEKNQKEISGWIAMEEGKLLLEEQQFDKAVIALTEAVRSNDQNAEAFYALALAHGHQQQYSEALKNIDQALKLKPDEATYLNVRKILENNARATGK